MFERLDMGDDWVVGIFCPICVFAYGFVAVSRAGDIAEVVCDGFEVRYRE